MLTLGFGLLLAELANSAGWLTGGMDGLQGIHTWKLLGYFAFDLYGYVAYGYALAVLFVLFLFARRLIHSPFGLSLRGIRENARAHAGDRRAEPAHIRTIYTIAAAIAGVAGAFSRRPPKPCRSIRSVSSAPPKWWSCWCSAAPAGSMAAWSAPSSLWSRATSSPASMPQYWYFWIGILLVGVVIFLPNGILGGLAKLTSRWSRS